MHIVIILKLFHFYLFNFSYKSGTLVLGHSHITAWSGITLQIIFNKAVDGFTTSTRMCKGKGTSFQAPAVANWLFSDPHASLSNVQPFFSELPKAYKRKCKAFAYMSDC